MSEKLSLMSYVDEEDGGELRLDVAILAGLSERIYQSGLRLEENTEQLAELYRNAGELLSEGGLMPDRYNDLILSYKDRIRYWQQSVKLNQRAYDMVKELSAQHARQMLVSG